ncbi:unnamed protein product [Protopolystoma xenopodis]|uniref:Uncharacterized protein n=1 Tax=Protopolystoma xenopodis TaxID=117903 RepID=A0A3S5AQ20_9PLAT|nr:unnamed protein product [Protopolystoma xenopodis]
MNPVQSCLQQLAMLPFPVRIPLEWWRLVPNCAGQTFVVACSPSLATPIGSMTRRSRRQHRQHRQKRRDIGEA